MCPSGYPIARHSTVGLSGTKWAGTAHVGSGGDNRRQTPEKQRAAGIAQRPKLPVSHGLVRVGPRRRNSITPRGNAQDYPREECRSDCAIWDRRSSQRVRLCWIVSRRFLTGPSSRKPALAEAR